MPRILIGIDAEVKNYAISWQRGNTLSHFSHR
jgi:hypothetical protein